MSVSVGFRGRKRATCQYGLYEAATDDGDSGSKNLKVTYDGESDSHWDGLTFCYWVRWRKEGDIGADLSYVNKGKLCGFSEYGTPDT